MREAESGLTELLKLVDLTAPSSTKFEQVRSWIATRTGLPHQKVCVYWVSKAGNFDVRFRQPGVLRDKPVLGVALIPGGENLDSYRKPARRLVESRLFEAIAICSRWGDNWIGEAAFVRDSSEIDATAGGLVDDDQVLIVSDGGDTEDPPEIDESEPPSGLDVSPSVGWGEYPLDAVFVRTETRTVSEVVKRIKAGRYRLDPEFQRDFVWPVNKQSRLIESCAMRIPLPVFYVAESRDGRIIVVDGLQRLTTFSRFLDDEFALSGLDDPQRDIHHPLSGLKFSQLPVSMSERIEDTQLTLYILDAKAPERAKLDIFERVNSGVPLSRQQMRNCLFNGPATQWLRDAACDAAFVSATGRSLDSKTMRDREAINRFCAFQVSGWSAYKTGDMDGFLAQTLERMNELSSADLDGMIASFRQSMRLNELLFGRHAFRKSLAHKTPHAQRAVINIALFDVCSVVLANSNPLHVEAAILPIQDGLSRLIENPEFNHAITYSTNSTRQVHTRFRMTIDAIGEFI